MMINRKTVVYTSDVKSLLPLIEILQNTHYCIVPGNKPHPDEFLELEKVISNKIYITHGVNDELKRVVCRDVDLIPPPKVYHEINLDGDTWYVADVKSPFGHLIITLARRVS